MTGWLPTRKTLTSSKGLPRWVEANGFSGRYHGLFDRVSHSLTTSSYGKDATVMCDRQVVRGGTSADSVSFIPLCRAPLPPCADWHGSAALHSAWSRALDPMCVCAFVRRGRLPPVFSSRGFFSCQSSHPSTCQRPTRGWQRTVLSSTCCAASCCLRTFWPARLLHVCFPFALSFLGDIARVCTLFF